jgi:hypothetical protein
VPSLVELRAELDRRIAKGDGEVRGALLLPQVEARSRVKNEKGRTRFIWELDSPQFYSRFNTQKNRYLEVIENKTVALEVFLDVLESVADERLRELAKGERP